MKAITYKGHTIAEEARGESIYSILGGHPGYTIKGPHIYLGGSPTLRGAKSMVDNAIQKASMKQRERENRIGMNDGTETIEFAVSKTGIEHQVRHAWEQHDGTWLVEPFCGRSFIAQTISATRTGSPVCQKC